LPPIFVLIVVPIFAAIFVADFIATFAVIGAWAYSISFMVRAF
jgi:hypothetical protein